MPLVLLGLVVAHILALHDVGSNNPDGIEIKGPEAPLDAQGHPLDGIPFHPYYTVHDIFGVSVFLMVFSAIIFFAPEVGGYFLEYNNFIPADPLKTPLHIAPVWYFTPYYSMLRAITTEMMYALSAILVLAVGFRAAQDVGFLADQRAPAGPDGRVPVDVQRLRLHAASACCRASTRSSGAWS